MLIMHFSCYKGILNEMLSRFGLFLNTVVRINRKEKVILQNTPHQKITKIQLFDLICTILNRYAYESRNMEMINSEVIKNLSKLFYIPKVKNLDFNQKY